MLSGHPSSSTFFIGGTSGTRIRLALRLLVASEPAWQSVTVENG